MHETSIFPCGIFQYKKGINDKPGTPNYDLKRLALLSSAKRLYPNWANCDWSTQKEWVKYDREVKLNILKNLSDKNYAKLVNRFKKNPELCHNLGLQVTNHDTIMTIIDEELPFEMNATMGCRTVNGADVNIDIAFKENIKSIIETGEITNDCLSAVQKDGRGNICPVTIILPTLAMEANEKNPKDVVGAFFEILTEAIDDAKEQLIARYQWISAQSPKAASFMYENHTMVGYKPEEGIQSALCHGTLALGQLGLAEALEILIGCNHVKPEGMELAKKIESLFKTKCNEYKKQYHLNFGVYYSPAENLCHTAMKKFQKKYGIIEKISDHEYFTNSIHVPVWEEVNPMEKILIESKLTGYSSAGCITYVELDSKIEDNIDAMETLVDYAMEHDIPYFATNIPNDFCVDCGYTGDIPLDENCPKCGGSKIKRLKRVTGYLTGSYTEAFNKGKQQEAEMRFKHTQKFI